MKKIVEKFLDKKNLLLEKETFIVAFSGGFDSMVLADILIDLSKEYKFNIVLAHLNHNWRGKKSKQEEENCRKYAFQKGVDINIETLSSDLPHTETVARQERYAFLERVAKRHNSKYIFTAHTKSDNIETVIQRIIKGTGISGLQGIQAARKLDCAMVYRPLLKCSRDEILEYCENKKLHPNNDDSNKNIKYFRNRIRQKLLPELKKNYDKNIEEAICRLIQNAIDSEKIIDEFSRRELAEVIVGEQIITKEFEKLSSPMKKRIIKNLLEINNLDYDQRKINEILDFIKEVASSKSGKTFSLTAGLWLFVNNKIMEVIDEKQYNSIFASKELNLDGETYLEEFNACIKVTPWDDRIPTEFPKDTSDVIFADLSNIKYPLTFRTRIYGDKIIPFGKKSPIKLKKYLNNKKLSKHEKSKVLLISSPDEVLWVINWGISNNIKVINMPTHKIEFYYKEK